MLAPFFFGSAAVALIYLERQLLRHVWRAQKNVALSKEISVDLHKNYGYLLSAFALLLCVALPVAMKFLLAGEARHAPPHALLLTSRILGYALLPLLGAIIFRANGRRYEKLHKIFGWSSLAIFNALAVIGTILYFQMF